MERQFKSLMKSILIFAVMFFVAFNVRTYAVDNCVWPQYHGPNRDRISHETDWNKNLKEDNILWEKEVGIGFSSMSVCDGLVYTMGNIEDKDYVWCFNADTGEKVWEFSYPCKLFDNMHEGGPGCTPTVDGELVFTVSKEGHLFCLDAKTGDQIWSMMVTDKFGVEMPRWRFANSPMLYGDEIIIDVGVIASLDKKTGEVNWKTKNYGPAYASVKQFELNNKTCLAALPAMGLVILDAENGKELATYPWETKYGINATTPIVDGNKAFISTGYQKGCALVKITENFEIEEQWKNRNIRAQINTPVFYEGYFYGFDESMLKCVDAKTGDEKWRKRGLGKGSLMLAGDTLIILGEDGELITADAAPTEFKPISQIKPLDGRCWTIPVLANKKIYCRNAEGNLICIDVK